MSVSFTTNFQNIGVGYGGFGVPLRAGGLWLPQLLNQALFAPLPKEVGSKLDKAFEELQEFLSGKSGQISESCKTNVLDKLATIGFNKESFLQYLSRGHDFYDGTQSQATIGMALGFFQTIKGPGINSSTTISDLFGMVRGTRALTSAGFSVNALTIFFNPGAIRSSAIDSPYLRAMLFHEALHGYGSSLTGGLPGAYDSAFGAYGDKPLLRLFHLDPFGKTSQLTTYIKENCF